MQLTAAGIVRSSAASKFYFDQFWDSFNLNDTKMCLRFGFKSLIEVLFIKSVMVDICPYR